jgi:hypothetical protein
LRHNGSNLKQCFNVENSSEMYKFLQKLAQLCVAKKQ